MIPALSILGALTSQTVGDIAGNAVSTLPSASSNSANDFGAVLEQVANDAVGKLETGEATAISGIEGKASVQQVVNAVSDAQMSLQEVLAIRDKLVSAYQEVTRMQI